MEPVKVGPVFAENIPLYLGAGLFPRKKDAGLPGSPDCVFSSEGGWRRLRRMAMAEPLAGAVCPCTPCLDTKYLNALGGALTDSHENGGRRSRPATGIPGPQGPA